MTAPNPFGRWTKHRSDLANLIRGGDAAAADEKRLRQLMQAARLADKVLADRDALTSEQRDTLRGLI